jgi:hypothetical protein
MSLSGCIPGDIYKATKECIVWLGEPERQAAFSATVGSIGTGNNAVADYFAQSHVFDWAALSGITGMDVIREFFRDKRQFDQWDVLGGIIILVLLFSGHHFDKFPFFAKGDDISMHASALWNNSSNALFYLLDAPYWSRVWIIQEVVLAPKAKIYYGKHILPFSFANNAQVILTHHYYGCCARWGVNANGSQWTVWTQLVEKMISIGHIRELKIASTLSNHNDSGKHLTMYKILKNRSISSKASDLRDHIFGQLGLVKDWRGYKIMPDYSLTTAQVYTQATFKMLEQENSLEPLTRCEIGGNLQLPSWVPDWSYKPLFASYPYPWDLYNAVGIEPPSPSLHSSSILRLRSMHVVTWSG